MWSPITASETSVRPPRPFTRKDREDLVQWLYLLHTRAIAEKNFGVAIRSSLVIRDISAAWRQLEKT